MSHLLWQAPPQEVDHPKLLVRQSHPNKSCATKRKRKERKGVRLSLSLYEARLRAKAHNGSKRGCVCVLQPDEVASVRKGGMEAANQPFLSKEL